MSAWDLQSREGGSLEQVNHSVIGMIEKSRVSWKSIAGRLALGGWEEILGESGVYTEAGKMSHVKLGGEGVKRRDLDRDKEGVI